MRLDARCLLQWGPLALGRDAEKREVDLMVLQLLQRPDQPPFARAAFDSLPRPRLSYVQTSA